MRNGNIEIASSDSFRNEKPEKTIWISDDDSSGFIILQFSPLRHECWGATRLVVSSSFLSELGCRFTAYQMKTTSRVSTKSRQRWYMLIRISTVKETEKNKINSHCQILDSLCFASSLTGSLFLFANVAKLVLYLICLKRPWRKMSKHTHRR